MSTYKDVFISYSSLEYSEAAIIRSVLETNGISCWMAPESIPVGSDYTKEIPAAINNCRIFLLILSDNAQRSKWVPLELDRAFNAEKIILPFVIKNCTLTDDFNFMLARTQRIEGYHQKAAALGTLVDEILGILRGTQPAQRPKVKKRRGMIVGICAAAAVVVTLVTLLACGVFSPGSQDDETPAATEPVTEPETSTEDPKPGPISDYIGVLREVTFENKSYSPAVKQTFRLPEILIDSADAREVNDEILEKYGSIMDAAASPDSSVYNTFLDYDSYLTGSILSVVINAEYGSGHEWHYSVYNFDVTTGKKLTNRTLCKMIGTDWDTMKSTLKSVLKTFFVNNWPQYENTQSMYSTLDSETLETARLFIGNTRKVRALCTIYIAAGSGQLQRFVDIGTYNY